MMLTSGDKVNHAKNFTGIEEDIMMVDYIAMYTFYYDLTFLLIK